ncbi:MULTISPECIES: heavy metal translocating P-type ATPase [Olivibacter]|uniref:P-type Zn(2+) transporter n=2 Tax=Olivibacter TaxID=376469 RepID=A0ABV6HIP4_9SPHI|nr:heavy metal translocating P-type ATPase [Olivibacter jilunii]
MKKTKLNIDILFPDITNGDDKCIDRLITHLEGYKGIEKVHLSKKADQKAAQLCFHYDPGRMHAGEVVQIAKRVGAELNNRYGHMLLQNAKVREPRQAKRLENSLRKIKGVTQVSVAGTGMISLEYDDTLVHKNILLKKLENEDVRLVQESGHSLEKKKEKLQHPSDDNRKGDKKNTVESEGDKQIKVSGDADTGHEHGGWFGHNSELIFSLICGALLGIGYGLTFIEGVSEWIPKGFFWGAYFFGAYYVIIEAYEAISKGEFEIDFLMLVAALGAGILGQWEEGALLLFLFSLGHALEHFAMEKARKSIEALADLAPKTALRKNQNGTEEVPIEELGVDDVIVARPNTRIAADGIIINGTSSVDQSPITGESIPVDKSALENSSGKVDFQTVDQKYKAFSGSINGNGTLEIKVVRTAKDSTISRVIEMVNEAQTQKSPTQQFTDRFEKFFVPAVLLLVVLLCFAFLVIDEPFKDSFYRAMAVLVAASPCALAISTPSAVLSGVARAARGGVLVKGGRPLEDLGSLTALAFDKTGTLTEGKPKLTEVKPLEGTSEEELLGIAVAVESLSDHPLAKAIVRDGKARLKDRQIPSAENLEAILGKGIRAKLGQNTIYLGNLPLFEKLDDRTPSDELVSAVRALESKGNTTMVLRKDDSYLGLIAVMDTPRAEAADTLKSLRELGVKRMIMLTGDNQQVADAIAEKVKLTDAWGGLLPEDKVEAIKKLRNEEKKVAMVGDGVNDAPAMANSTVGIAMGAAGSDVALETADIALMGDKLNLLPFAIGLSRKSKRIIKQNLWISLGVVAVLIPLTILGVTSIGPAVMAHEGSTLIVVFNALRLLAYKVK